MAQIALAAQGVRYLDGGWGAMIASLAAAATAAGAQIRMGARVDRIAKDADRWRVTLANGEQFVAGSIVLSVSPHEAAAMAPGVAALRDAAGYAVPARLTSLDVALTRLPCPDRTFALGTETPVYFSVHSNAAKLAPPGGALIHVARYLGAAAAAPDARAELEGVLDLMQPGWRDALVVQQFFPMATVTHDIPQAARGGLDGRCPVAVGDGLYAAGDWVGDEGMLSDAAFASGAAAGTLAAKRKALAAA